MSYRVLLVDDHARLRELYRLALQDEPRLEVVGEAGDGASAVACARAQRPDLVVLDLSMPNRDGLQALQDLKRELPEARVLVLSGFLRERVEGLVLDLGANAYKEKGMGIRDIPSALLAVAEEAPRQAGRVYSESELERRVHDLV